MDEKYLNAAANYLGEDQRMLRIMGIVIVLGAVGDHFVFGGRLTDAAREILFQILAHAR
jgi:hypothetical protein